MTRVTDLDIERFLVDDLDDADRVRVAAAVAADPALAANVAARLSTARWQSRSMARSRVWSSGGKKRMSSVSTRCWSCDCPYARTKALMRARRRGSLSNCWLKT
jgi:hypothetical protein